jgi:hypothetical protein
LILTFPCAVYTLCNMNYIWDEKKNEANTVVSG